MGQDNNERGIDLKFRQEIDYGILHYGKIDQEIKQIKTREWGTLFLLTNGELRIWNHTLDDAMNVRPESYKKCFFISNFGDDGFLGILENNKAIHISPEILEVTGNFENAIKISCDKTYNKNFALLLRDGTVRVYPNNRLQPNEETEQILDSNNVIDVAIDSLFVVARLSSGKLVVWGPFAYLFDLNTTTQSGHGPIILLFNLCFIIDLIFFSKFQISIGKVYYKLKTKTYRILFWIKISIVPSSFSITRKRSYAFC